MKNKVNEVIIVLDNIRSRENVGSIFRTADAAGVKKIFLCGITPRPSQYQVSSIKYQGETDKIAKTALGAEKWVPWEYHKQTWRTLENLKKEVVNIVALEQTRDSKNIFMYKFPKNNRPTKSGESRPKGAEKIILVLGNEVNGLSPRILKYCDEVAQIPMYGKKESLNVAVVAGIALYQIIK